MEEQNETKQAEETTETQETTASAAQASSRVITFDEQAFSERMERARRSAIQKKFKEYGFESEDQFKNYLDEAKRLKEDSEQRRLAEMSELERERQAREQAEQRAAQYEQQAEEAKMDAHLFRLCTQHGVKDVDYFKYKLLQAVNRLPEGEELDEAQLLQDLLEDPTQRVALGAQSVAQEPVSPVVQNVQSPANTSPVYNPRPGTAGGPPSAPHSGSMAPQKSAFDLSPAEWQAKKRAMGLPV